MKLKVWQPADVEVHAIAITIPKSCIHEDDDVPDVFRNLNPDTPELFFHINTHGYVSGWGEALGRPGARLQLKVRDEGVYSLRCGDDNNGPTIADYVPDCVPDGGGDYIDLDIDDDGCVKNWSAFWTTDNIRRSFFPVPDCQPEDDE